MSHPLYARTAASPLALKAAGALLGAALFVMPHFAHADSVVGKPIQLVQADTSSGSHKSMGAKAATDMKPGSVEERIQQLHGALKITPDEENNWNAVAQAMRDNAMAMQKLAAEKHDQAPQSMTAVDSLKTYQEFAQAHVDGLKNLSSAFGTLYDAMPDAQKKNADMVFQTFGRGRGRAASHTKG